MKLADQQLVFSLFHDGSIVEIMEQEMNYSFKVDILFLAERVNSKFHAFRIRLGQPEEFIFEDSDTNTIIVDLDEINKLELEILKTEIQDDKIMVFCSAEQGNRLGFLTIKTNEIRIYDQEYNPLKLEELEQIARTYWEEFGERTLL